MSTGPNRTILVTGTSLVPRETIHSIRDRGFEVRHVQKDQFTADELDHALNQASGYLIGGYEEPTALNFERADALEAVAWIGSDYQGFVPGWQRAFDLGIAFVNTPGENAASVAEFAALLMLGLARPFGRQILTGVDDAPSPPPPGFELRGRTLGILGAGRIAGRLAAIAGPGLGMRVIYHARHRNESLEQFSGLTYATMPELLETSDVISLHRPAPAPHEPPLFNRTSFERMRSGALLINTVHRDLVDPKALLWAAEEKGIRAAFDGLGHEPPVEWEPLLELGPERILAVAAMGFNTRDANLRSAGRAATAVCDVLAGRTNADVNNPDFLIARKAARRQSA